MRLGNDMSECVNLQKYPIFGNQNQFILLVLLYENSFLV
jgi:hypothetical protein